MLDSHLVEFCTLFIITTNNNDNDFERCIAKPKLFCFFNFISWLVYYPFVCALFVINWIKLTLWSYFGACGTWIRKTQFCNKTFHYVVVLKLQWMDAWCFSHFVFGLHQPALITMLIR